MQLINNILNKLLLSAENDGFILLEKIGNISSDIFNIKPLSLLFEERVKIFVNSLSLFLIFIFLSYFILSSILARNSIIYTNFKKVIQVIIIAIISLNSYSICKEIVKLNFVFTGGINDILESLIDEKIEYTRLKENVDTLEEYIKVQDKISTKGVKDTIVFVILILLLVVFSVRYVILVLLVIASPIFVLFILSKRTQFLFAIWIKVFLYNLTVQNVNKILLFICISAKEEKEIYGCVLVGTCILLYIVNKKAGDI